MERTAHAPILGTVGPPSGLGLPLWRRQGCSGVRLWSSDGEVYPFHVTLGVGRFGSARFKSGACGQSLRGIRRSEFPGFPGFPGFPVGKAPATRMRAGAITAASPSGCEERM